MTPEISYSATHRFARISVAQGPAAADLIRGKYADDALDILKYLPHRGARMIEKVLKSAMANAEDRGRPQRRATWSSSTPASTAARCSSGSCPAPAAWPT